MPYNGKLSPVVEDGMRIVHNILMGVAILSLLLSISCCCTGGLDDDNINLNLPGQHNEGTGGDV
jgi:hypothetical protein